MKPPYLSLNIRLLFSTKISDPVFGSGLESGFESGAEMFISVPDRIRPKVSDPYGSGSATLPTTYLSNGSGSTTLEHIVHFFYTVIKNCYDSPAVKKECSRSGTPACLWLAPAVAVAAVAAAAAVVVAAAVVAVAVAVAAGGLWSGHPSPATSHLPLAQPTTYTRFLLKHPFPLLSFLSFLSENVKIIFFTQCIVTLTRRDYYMQVENSVADSGCLYRIPNPNFSIPDLGSRVKKIPEPDPHPHLKYFLLLRLQVPYF
jgi:hypothetical protein